MRTASDVLRSLKRYLAESLGDAWEVRLADEEGTFTRPFAMVWHAGPEVSTSRARWADVSQPFVVHLYPEPAPDDPQTSLLRALDAQDLLTRAFEVGVGLGRPLRVPIYDYAGVSLTQAATLRGHHADGPTGESIHGDYARVEGGLSTLREPDRDDATLWTVSLTTRLGWRRQGRVPSSAVTVTSVNVQSGPRGRTQLATKKNQQADPQEQTAAVVEAEEARAAEREAKAPEGEDAPTDLQPRGGRREAAYSHERLVNEATDFLGQPPHVVAGALALNEKEYLTVAEAENLVQTFLDRPVNQEG